MIMFTDEKLLNLLIQYNPWWKGVPITGKNSPPKHRFAYHEAEKLLLHKDLRRFVVLSGARRVGKTTIMYQLISKLLKTGVAARNIVYLSFDNPILKLGGFEGVLRAYDNAYGSDEEMYFFFDEVQYAENWEVWIKILYDSRPNLRLVATGSASPTLEKGSADSGVGRWSVLKISTLSFYEYCDLLEINSRPELPKGIRPTQLYKMSKGDLSELIGKLSPLQQHFNRYLIIGGFPELALSSDDALSQRMLREDVVDKVIKRDILTLFNVRNPLQLEKVFLYLCMHSSSIINITTICKELDGMNKATLTSYIQFLKEANLIYISDPVGVDGKGILKGRSKIYVADAAIRNAVLMLEDVITNPEEMGIMVETAVYKHIAAFYYTTNARVGYYRRVKENEKEVDVVVELPFGRILCEVKYRENSQVKETDAIIELTNDEKAKVQGSLIITKRAEDYGITSHHTRIPVVRIPAFAFLYLLGNAENEGYAANM
ncbi:MAG: ATP-binding protein [Peptostreptococcaceae bacterium]|nr:ATP-binding protein [Peptostreptococcaceae bacterium]